MANDPKHVAELIKSAEKKLWTLEKDQLIATIGAAAIFYSEGKVEAYQGVMRPVLDAVKCTPSEKIAYITHYTKVLDEAAKKLTKKMNDITRP